MHAPFFIFREPYKKIKTLLFVSVYFLSVLHLQYEHILLMSEYLEEISRKELYRIHVTFAWIWGLTGITFAWTKSITIARKMYTRFVLHLPCLHLRGLSVI
jgi:hypothetical protein